MSVWVGWGPTGDQYSWSKNSNSCPEINAHDLSIKLIDEHCEEENPRVSCLPIGGSGALPQAAHQHLSPRAVMLSPVRPSVLPPCAYARHALPWGRQCPPPLCPQPASPLLAQALQPPSSCCLNAPFPLPWNARRLGRNQVGSLIREVIAEDTWRWGGTRPSKLNNLTWSRFPYHQQKELQELLRKGLYTKCRKMT